MAVVMLKKQLWFTERDWLNAFSTTIPLAWADELHLPTAESDDGHEGFILQGHSSQDRGDGGGATHALGHSASCY